MRERRRRGVAGVLALQLVREVVVASFLDRGWSQLQAGEVAGSELAGPRVVDQHGGVRQLVDQGLTGACLRLTEARRPETFEIRLRLTHGRDDRKRAGDDDRPH